MRLSRIFFIIVLLAAAGTAAAMASDTTRPSTDPRTYLLHLPGIDGYRGSDRRMLAGLLDGGVSAQIQVYDWTDHDPGIDALHAQSRNHREAAKIAAIIADHARNSPGNPIDLTAHSGGCGVAVWALEQLPSDVAVDTVLLLAPALSPKYDLSKALRHVRGNVYVFSSLNDSIVLYTGTSLFGTIDGVLTPAAGYGGFIRPTGADLEEYKKIIPRPYEPDWKQYFDFGGHLGTMSRPFAAAVLAPLLAAPQPTTRPSENYVNP
jgi:hypothetical protein